MWYYKKPQQPIFRRFASRFIVVATILSVAPAIWIGSAYAMQLSLTRPPIVTSGNFLRPSASTEPFLKRLSQSVATTRSKLLWSVYPASVRGQVILDVTPGGDPLATGGW